MIAFAVVGWGQVRAVRDGSGPMVGTWTLAQGSPHSLTGTMVFEASGAFREHWLHAVKNLRSSEDTAGTYRLKGVTLTLTVTKNNQTFPYPGGRTQMLGLPHFPRPLLIEWKDRDHFDARFGGISAPIAFSRQVRLKR